MEVEKELINPSKDSNMDETVNNTRIQKVEVAELAVKDSLEDLIVRQCQI